jgi:predicted nucleic acid-binding protein
MMRILLDTNVVLDVLLDRQPFVADSRKVWQAADEGRFDACLAAFTIPTIFYICRRQGGSAAAARAVDICLEAFEIASLYRECILAARRMPGGDFEDNLQIASAITDFMQGIVTRNPADFAVSPIRVYTPDEFLAGIQK